MANELPYFRFIVQAWQNGKISLEAYELKGIFIDVYGYYYFELFGRKVLEGMDIETAVWYCYNKLNSKK